MIAQSARDLERTRAHERVHVRQCETWGPLFFAAYGIAALLARVRGGHAYRDNVFEREARGAEQEPSSGEVRRA